MQKVCRPTQTPNKPRVQMLAAKICNGRKGLPAKLNLNLEVFSIRDKQQLANSQKCKFKKGETVA